MKYSIGEKVYFTINSTNSIKSDRISDYVVSAKSTSYILLDTALSMLEDNLFESFEDARSSLISDVREYADRKIKTIKELKDI